MTNARQFLLTVPGDALSYNAGTSVDTEALGGNTVAGFAGATWRPSRNLSIKVATRFQDYEGWLLHQEGFEFTTFDAEQWTHEIDFEYFPAAKQHFQVALQWVGIRATESGFFSLSPGSTDLVPVDKPPGPPDDISLSQLNFQVRYRWQIAPLSDLFVVYTKADSRQAGLAPFATFSGIPGTNRWATSSSSSCATDWDRGDRVPSFRALFPYTVCLTGTVAGGTQWPVDSPKTERYRSRSTQPSRMR